MLTHSGKFEFNDPSGQANLLEDWLLGSDT